MNAMRIEYQQWCKFALHTLNTVILEFNATFCWELVPFDFLLVGLHTISIISFYLCMLEVVFELE